LKAAEEKIHTKDQQIKVLKQALANAIKDNQRVYRFQSPEDDEISFTWTKNTRQWAKLADLDLSTLSLDHY